MKKLIIIASIFYFIPILIWWLILGVLNNGVLSNNNADWGSFGSFVGGVLSPLFSLCSILFLYQSIKDNDKNHNAQLNVLQRFNRREQLVKLIDIYNSKLNEPLNNQFGKLLKDKCAMINIYTDNSEVIPFPDITVGQFLIDFDLSKSKKKTHTEQYIDVLKSTTANVELCFCKILEQLNSIEDIDELEDLVDLTGALCEFHSTIALLEYGLSCFLYDKKSPLLERLEQLNERTSFRGEIVSRYVELKELKVDSENRNNS
ncbi:hypothetical protein P3748_16925 [Vibrio parahaemolyticus]|nr:hypothetical protein [Vibrio parahaemolyticus]MDF5038161.1 hypothetical protein [Vibrio parahaemolyticus]MDF5686905.1 hypothetical protein [Vibrio parahaemolyticus]